MDEQHDEPGSIPLEYLRPRTSPEIEPHHGVGGSLRRSRDLTAGHRMRALLCYGLPYGAVTVGLSFATSAVESVTGGQGVLLGLMAGTFLTMAFTPFVAALQLMLYLDLRVRKEALDLEAGIAALGWEESPA